MVLTNQTTFISIRKVYTCRVFGDNVQVYLCGLHVIHKRNPHFFFNAGISGFYLQSRSIPRPLLFV